MKDILIFGRFAKNILYVFSGIIIGVMMAGDVEPVKLDWIVLGTTGAIFLYEAVIYMRILYKTFAKGRVSE